MITEKTLLEKINFKNYTNFTENINLYIHGPQKHHKKTIPRYIVIT